MAQTLQQRLVQVERSVASLAEKVSSLAPAGKDWRRAVGSLRDTPFNREVDRLGRVFRKRQGRST